LAEKYGATVNVLYVTEDLAHHKPWYGGFDLSHINKIVEREKEKATERQQKVCHKHLEDCAAYSKHIVVGDPAKEILDFIGKEEIDMVVMCKKEKRATLIWAVLLRKLYQTPRFR
jgi:nucleotide-binding universal stress UspA family protein